MNFRRIFIMVLAIAILISPYYHQIGGAQFDEQILYYRRITRISNSGVEATTGGSIKILLFPGALNRYQHIFEENIIPKPHSITEDEKGNRFATILLSSLAPNDSIDIIYECNIQAKQNSKYSWQSLTEEIEKNQGVLALTPGLSLEEKEMYLVDEKYVSPSHEGIKNLAIFLTEGIDDPLTKARRIFEYVNTTMEYDESSQYARKSSISAFYNLRGICTDFASLTVALMRSVNIPARLMGGYIFDESLPTANIKGINGTEIAHAWVEFFIEGIGWLPADPTQIHYVGSERQAAMDYFARLSSWGYVVSSYGLEAASYLLQSDHFGGAVLQGQNGDLFTFSHRRLGEGIQVIINEKSRIIFPDAQPIITEVNRTFVPLRVIFEALGATVNYEEEGQRIKAHLRGREIELAIGEAQIVVDGFSIPLEMAPYIDEKYWRTMIPLRAIVEAFAIDVFWSAQTNQIYLSNVP